MSQMILFSPPLVFITIFLVILVLFHFSSRYSMRSGKEKSAGSRKAYACGEDFKEHLIQPDYSQFFPFAFYFTILHVVALVIATVPVENVMSFAMAVLYVTGAIIGLIILLRK